MYKDIIKVDSQIDQCGICGCVLEGGDSPWSICFDPHWEGDMWGGDLIK